MTDNLTSMLKRDDPEPFSNDRMERILQKTKDLLKGRGEQTLVELALVGGDESFVGIESAEAISRPVDGTMRSPRLKLTDDIHETSDRIARISDQFTPMTPPRPIRGYRRRLFAIAASVLLLLLLPTWAGSSETEWLVRDFRGEVVAVEDRSYPSTDAYKQRIERAKNHNWDQMSVRKANHGDAVADARALNSEGVAYNEIGKLRLSRDDPNGALDAFSKAEARLRKALLRCNGDADSATLRGGISTNLAITYMKMGKYELARELLRNADQEKIATIYNSLCLASKMRSIDDCKLWWSKMSPKHRRELKERMQKDCDLHFFQLLARNGVVDGFSTRERIASNTAPDVVSPAHVSCILPSANNLCHY